MGSRKDPAMSDPDLVFLSATAALTKFRRKELSPVELLDALIQHIESTDVTLNAVCDRRYDEARIEAAASAARYVGKGGEPRELDGLPLAAKEEHPMAGRSYSMGSLIYREAIADETHPIIERAQAAGATVTTLSRCLIHPRYHSPATQ
jgi:aspartyl-tRNA(Asn)/glutamyl-tRNA(Gln) amidotransferase subunit A